MSNGLKKRVYEDGLIIIGLVNKDIKVVITYFFNAYSVILMELLIIL